MQEEVEGKAVTLLVSGVRLSARTLKEVISRFLMSQRGRHRSYKNAGVEKKGKQSVKSLMKTGQSVVPMEVKGDGIRKLERITRKYEIDYAIKKVKGTETPTYQIYFKAKDKDMILNTNLEFSQWVNVLYDQRMTTALIGRLTHHVELILFPGGNNRLRESSINDSIGQISNNKEVKKHARK